MGRCLTDLRLLFWSPQPHQVVIAFPQDAPMPPVCVHVVVANLLNNRVSHARLGRGPRPVPCSARARGLTTRGRVGVSPKTTPPVGWPFLARTVCFFFSASRLLAPVSRRRVLDPGEWDRPDHARPLWQAPFSRASIPPVLGIPWEPARSHAYLSDTRVLATEPAPPTWDLHSAATHGEARPS